MNPARTYPSLNDTVGLGSVLAGMNYEPIFNS